MSDTYIDETRNPAVRENRRNGIYRSGGKRVFDVVLVLLAAPIVLPLIFVVWAIAARSGGSGFFRQARVGRGGQVFRCWKIRSMAVDADEKLAKLLESDANLAAEWCATQKLMNDPRVTAFGRFLRASSLDELPQLWNVLIGDMSLIGPRPFTPHQRSLYDALPSRQSYYRLRPGITGLWQVRSRNIGNFQDRVGFDEVYAENLSFAGDLRIALRTAIVVLRCSGK